MHHARLPVLVIISLVASCSYLSPVDDDTELSTNSNPAIRRTCPAGSVRQGNTCVALPACGDRSCNGTETCSTCAADCGPCTVCGDSTCNGTESCSSCA